jgi:HK97 gp10 family phage protein
MGFDIDIKFNYLPTIGEDVTEDMSGVVKKTTLNVESGAKQKSRVDTGQMRGGWNSEFPDPLTGIVSNPVEHTIHNEFGTRHMSAQPMIRPAAEENRQPFLDDCAAVLKGAGK